MNTRIESNRQPRSLNESGKPCSRIRPIAFLFVFRNIGQVLSLFSPYLCSIEGTTTVRILVGYDGEVESVIVAESSGNAALDAAAVDACYGWRFSGAKNGVGQKIRCYTYVPITFRLRSI